MRTLCEHPDCGKLVSARYGTLSRPGQPDGVAACKGHSNVRAWHPAYAEGMVLNLRQGAAEAGGKVIDARARFAARSGGDRD